MHTWYRFMQASQLQTVIIMVRKLRGPVKKESKEERRLRRRENLEGKQRILTVALPIVAIVILLVFVLVYLGTKKQ